MAEPTVKHNRRPPSLDLGFCLQERKERGDAPQTLLFFNLVVKQLVHHAFTFFFFFNESYLWVRTSMTRTICMLFWLKLSFSFWLELYTLCLCFFIYFKDSDQFKIMIPMLIIVMFSEIRRHISSYSLCTELTITTGYFLSTPNWTHGPALLTYASKNKIDKTRIWIWIK